MNKRELERLVNRAVRWQKRREELMDAESGEGTAIPDWVDQIQYSDDEAAAIASTLADMKGKR